MNGNSLRTVNDINVMEVTKMSKVYGQLWSDIGESARTRRGTKYIETEVKTWNGSARMHLGDDEQLTITVDNLDVKINGNMMHRGRREEHQIPMEDLLQLMESRWKLESARYARLPKKEFQKFRDLMLFQHVVKQS